MKRWADKDSPLAAEMRRQRPTRRSECRGGQRPCPWVSCRYHLYLDVDQDNGAIKFNHPDKEPWELEHSCAMDIIEELDEERHLKLGEIGKLFGVCDQRINELIDASLTDIARRNKFMRAFLDLQHKQSGWVQPPRGPSTQLDKRQ